ncbi:hypothetical protein GCK32_011516 [Trichostrongylus colubriformis]|uniref:Uncharacterized protein n=1 Tax=Trichostrongylus colubriformis TaxID=6319 RepID=A0AAN8G2Z4_TRICO
MDVLTFLSTTYEELNGSTKYTTDDNSTTEIKPIKVTKKPGMMNTRVEKKTLPSSFNFSTWNPSYTITTDYVRD